MRVGISGFGEFADTLHIDLSKRVNWRMITSVLGIDGVTYYYVQAGTIGVRYNKAVNPVDVAAACLVILAHHFDVEAVDMELTVSDLFVKEEESAEIGRNIQLRALTVTAPQEIPVSNVTARGSTPAYYLT